MVADLELIVSEAKEVMEDCIERIREFDKETYGELKSAIDEEIGNFDGYWKCVYRRIEDNFGSAKAKEFQKDMIIHHYNLTKNKGFEGVLKYFIGFDINWDDYKKIIEKISKTKPMGGAGAGFGAV